MNKCGQREVKIELKWEEIKKRAKKIKLKYKKYSEKEYNRLKY